ILYKVRIVAVNGHTDREVTDLQIDSRKIGPGAVFIAQKGTESDGHQFIEAAVKKGAVAVICEQMPPQLEDGVTYVQVADAAKAAGLMASHFYGDPSSRLKLTGVTGTNGKT